MANMISDISGLKRQGQSRLKGGVGQGKKGRISTKQKEKKGHYIDRGP